MADLQLANNFLFINRSMQENKRKDRNAFNIDRFVDELHLIFNKFLTVGYELAKCKSNRIKNQ